MARRKNNNTLRELFGSLLSIGLIVSFIVGFIWTHSFTGAFFLVGLVFIVGMLIIMLMRYQDNERLRRSGIDVIDKMDGRQFEFYLGQLFKSQGYSVEVTRASGDYGADLILKNANQRIAVQAKRYKKRVGIEAVQQVRASLDKYQCTEGWVVTTNWYTSQAHEQADASKVRLIDKDELISMILKMNPQAVPNPKKVIQEVSIDPVTCKCGEPMMIRKSARGEFWGCTTFPKCRHTMQI